MAESDSCTEQPGFKPSEFKCAKCKKRVKNGIQCDQCETVFHFKCGNVSGAPGELKWTCPNCEDKTLPTPLQEVRYQELERAYLLLMGECATYKKLYNDINIKHMNLKQEFDLLKSNSSVRIRNSKDSHQKTTVENNRQVSEPDLNKVNATAALKQGPSAINETQVTTNLTAPNVNKHMKNLNSDELESKQQNDDKFILVKKRQRKSPMIGTSSNTNNNLSATEQVKWIHICRLKENTTAEQVLNYLKQMNSQVKFMCDQLDARGAYASFKVGYPISFHETINKPEFWPEGVAIRPFWTIRNKNKNP